MKHPDSEVFVIRIWGAARSDGSWRGRIDHVNSGRSLLIEEIQQVVPFIQIFSPVRQPPDQPKKPGNNILK
ncbi:MAG: hypothetical protein HY781_12990 [Chloroflexi bacterium]|nr:hypothetical protein [Chloroflexota bacterium]